MSPKVLSGYVNISKDLRDFDHKLGDLLNHKDRRVRALGELFREIMPILLRWQDNEIKEGCDSQALLTHTVNIVTTIMLTMPLNAVKPAEVPAAWAYVGNLVHEQIRLHTAEMMASADDESTRH